MEQDCTPGVRSLAGSPFGGKASTEQGSTNHVRFTLQQDQEVSCHPTWNTPALFPLLQSTHTKAKIVGKLALGHTHRLADLFDIDFLRDMNPVLVRVGCASGKVQRLLRALNQPLACFTHRLDSCRSQPDHSG